MTLSIITMLLLDCLNAECHLYRVSHKYIILSVLMLSVLMLSAFMLNVAALLR
jgi:hypothetical protein